MSSTQFWVALLVSPIIKKVMPRIKKYVKLDEFDEVAKARVTTKQYPAYYSYFYALWIISLISTGIIGFFLIMIYLPEIAGTSVAISTFLGLINMIGIWFIAGALLDFIFWKISAENYRDYVMFRQLKEGWGYDINQQIVTLFKIGLVYYLVTLPVMAFLLFVL